MLKIRCKVCNTELEGHPTRTKCCGCDNLTTIKGDSITALDLSKVIMLNSIVENKTKNVLSSEDLKFQEDRRKRKINKGLLNSVQIK
jgi:hypothetical protein